MASIPKPVAPPPVTASVPAGPGAFRRLLRQREFILLLLLGAVIAFFAIQSPAARTERVYLDLIREMSPYVVAAIGMTLLMLAGELDISVGAMLALVGVVTVTIFNVTGNMWLGILAGLAMGPIIGCIYGFLVTRMGMNSLVTTLGGMFAIRGLVYVFTNKTPVIDQNGFKDFETLYHGEVGALPVPTLIALALVILFVFILSQTEFGRKVYAIGGNSTAARVSGIRVDRHRFILFVLCSTLAAISGLLITAQTGSGYFDAGATGFELVVISSVVLGGVSLAGGQGSLIGAIIGVFILGMTAKGLRLMGVQTNQHLIVIGIVMMVAVFSHDVRGRLARLRR
ncbi:MAG: ABC transporter permease [Anaerolineae bacterium]